MRKRLYTLFLLILTFNQNCVSQHAYIDETISVDKYNIPANSTQFYFPVSLFPIVEMNWEQKDNSTFVITPRIIEQEIDSFTLKWYSKHLFAMKEPLLFNVPLDKSVFRFTWLRTFDHPVVISIESKSEQVSLRWKVTDGMGGYDPGKIIVDQHKEIKKLDWDKLRSIIEEGDFWNMERSGAFGTDGAEWILEGVDPTKYHVVSVWSPTQGNFYKACSYLLELTDLVINEDKKY